MRLILLLSLIFGQQQVTDINFYGAIYKGMHLVRFTAEWSDNSKENFYQGKFIVDGDSAYMGTQMMIIPSKKVPETVIFTIINLWATTSNRYKFLWCYL